MSRGARAACIAAALAAPLVGAAGCGGGGGGGGPKVAVADFSFTPKQIQVKAGQTVTWTNRGQTTHNVKGPGFFSQALEPGKAYSFRFAKAGTYPYLCTLHPTLMRGRVVVE